MGKVRRCFPSSSNREAATRVSQLKGKEEQQEFPKQDASSRIVAKLFLVKHS